MKRPIRILASILLFPLLYFAFILVLTVQAGLPIWEAAKRILLELTVLSLTPNAVLRGRFPTLPEIASAGVPSYIVMGVVVVLVWAAISNVLLATGKYLTKLFNKLSYRNRVVVTGSFVIVVTIWVLLPMRPTPLPTTITIDVSQLVGEMPNHHRGFSQGGESQMRDLGYFESAMERLKELEPRFVRIDHIYEYYNVFSLDTAGIPRYDWSELDRVIDAIIASGAEPFICLSYTPPALTQTTAYAPPIDLDIWEELVFETVYHLNIERELGIRYWEVWNEPNLTSFWAGTIEEYLQLYAASARGALRADPTIQLGGPSTSSVPYFGSAFAILYEHNWITELAQFTEEQTLPLNFLSWHLYSQNSQDYPANIEIHQQWVAGLNPQPQLFLTEWNWNSGYVPEFDNGATNAFIANTIAEFSESPLDQAFYFEPIDGAAAWEGRWGLMRADGVAKPAYSAFQLMSELSGDRLLVENSQSVIGAIATRNNDDVTIVLWNNESEHPTRSIDVIISGLLSNTNLTANLYGADAASEDIVNGLLLETLQIEENRDGDWFLTLSIPRNAIRLLQFSLAD
jgi:hypothetical protein